MRALRAQVTMEFYIFVGMAFLAMSFVIAASANNVRELQNQKDFFLIKDVTLKLQKEVSIAATVEDGFERVFELPEKLESVISYDIFTGNKTITVNSSKSVFTVVIPKVIGNFSKGSNKIERKGGIIYINRD